MALKAHSFGNSSSIAVATWDMDSQTLSVTFRSGRSYEYQNVPENVWEGFTSAGSAGQYFHQQIKDTYS